MNFTDREKEILLQSLENEFGVPKEVQALMNKISGNEDIPSTKPIVEALTKEKVVRGETYYDTKKMCSVVCEGFSADGLIIVSAVSGNDTQSYALPVSELRKCHSW